MNVTASSSATSAFTASTTKTDTDPSPIQPRTDPSRTDPFLANLVNVASLRGAFICLTGEVKTLADIAITDPRQNKAFKDMLHGSIWDLYNQIHSWAYQEAKRLDGLQQPGEFWPFPGGRDTPPPEPETSPDAV